MRVPFSYKHSLFGPILAASFLGHAVLLTVGGLIPQFSRYTVEQAPSSMEVMIVEETRPVQEKVIEKEEIITSNDPVPVAPEIQKKPEVKKEVAEKSEVKKPIYIPPTKGALEEAKPDAIRNDPPVYPLIARENGWQGTVILRTLVRKDGRAGRIVVDKSSGYQILDNAAVAAVQNWQFVPARMGKLSFTSWIRVPIRFVLEKGR